MGLVCRDLTPARTENHAIRSPLPPFGDDARTWLQGGSSRAFWTLAPQCRARPEGISPGNGAFRPVVWPLPDERFKGLIERGKMCIFIFPGTAKSAGCADITGASRSSG